AGSRWWGIAPMVRAISPVERAALGVGTFLPTRISLRGAQIEAVDSTRVSGHGGTPTRLPSTRVSGYGGTPTRLPYSGVRDDRPGARAAFFLPESSNQRSSVDREDPRGSYRPRLRPATHFPRTIRSRPRRTLRVIPSPRGPKHADSRRISGRDWS